MLKPGKEKGGRNEQGKKPGRRNGKNMEKNEMQGVGGRSECHRESGQRRKSRQRCSSVPIFWEAAPTIVLIDRGEAIGGLEGFLKHVTPRNLKIAGIARAC
ncbi:unnamed protein product [Calypogeia fissa]